jgi:hypothetical protein
LMPSLANAPAGEGHDRSRLRELHLAMHLAKGAALNFLRVARFWGALCKGAVRLGCVAQVRVRISVCLERGGPRGEGAPATAAMPARRTRAAPLPY